MSKPLPRKLSRWCALAALFGFGGEAVAQRRTEDVEPQLFRYDITGVSVGGYTEAIHEDNSYRHGVSSTYDRIFYGPLVGGGIQGSIYHPNLFNYSLNGEAVVGWDEERTETDGGKTIDRSGWDYIRNLSGTATILQNKPYRANLFVSSAHSFRDYDFFNRVIVDSLRYGVNSGYSQGPVPFNVSVARYEEESDGYGFFTTLKQTTVNIDARNDRENGNSMFTYGLNDFERSYGVSDVSGIEHTFGLSDREVFGSRRNMEWRNSASYSNRDLDEGPSDSTPGDAFTAASDLTWDHLPNLTSTYYGHYLRDNSDEVESDNTDAGVGLRHKLYESLTSSMRGGMTRFTSDAAQSEFESTQYTAAWGEQYTKRIGRDARLTLGGTLGITHTDQDSSSSVPVIGEAHTFNSGTGPIDSFFLNLPRVSEFSISVWDQARTIHYTRNLDYEVEQIGERTMIRLIVGNPSGLTASTPVVVDYQAAPQGSGEIDGKFQDAEVRLTLFDNMVGIYGRYYNADNTGSKDILVEDITTYTAGVDYARKWLRAGAEYQVYDSTFSSYTAARAYQTFNFSPDEVSSVSLTLSEGTTDYDNSRGQEYYYSVIGRYHHALSRHWGFDADAGVSQRFSPLEDQFLAAVRPGVSYNIGQLSAKLSYDFEYRDTENGDQRTRHMVTARVRRSF